MKVLPLLVALLPAMGVLVASGGREEPAALTPTATAIPGEERTPTPGAAAAGRIAFTSNRDGNREIYVMNGDGSGVTRITNNLAFDAFPDWAPDGTRIAFECVRGGNSEVCVMNADGTGETNLTNDLAEDGEPDWSPVQTR